MNFDVLRYMGRLKDKSTRSYAIESLEFAIKVSAPAEAFELHKLRTPSVITLMEITHLKKAGFPDDKLTPDGEYEILVLAYKAGEEHAKKYWSKAVADYYDMSAYQLTGEEE